MKTKKKFKKVVKWKESEKSYFEIFFIVAIFFLGGFMFSMFSNEKIGMLIGLIGIVICMSLAWLSNNKREVYWEEV